MFPGGLHKYGWYEERTIRVGNTIIAPLCLLCHLLKLRLTAGQPSDQMYGISLATHSMSIKYPDQSTGKGNFPKYSRRKSQKCHTILFHIVASTVTCKITLTPA